MKSELVKKGPEKFDATSIDIAVKPLIESLFPYTMLIKGITVVKCSTQRPLVQSGRVVTDIRDAMFCVMKLAEAEERVPPELQAAVLNEQTMLAFWKGVKEWCPDDYSTFQFFLNEAGIGYKYNYDRPPSLSPPVTLKSYADAVAALSNVHLSSVVPLNAQEILPGYGAPPAVHGSLADP